MSSSHAEMLVADLQRIFRDRLLSVVAYGDHAHDDGTRQPLTTLALVRSLVTTDLEACAHASASWRRHGVGTPLVLPEAEFRRSLDAFPLEYGEMLRSRRPLFGADPFQDVTIAAADVRRACETQAKSHLVHLREAFIEAEGKPRAIAEVVTASAAPFAALLRNIARLHGPLHRDPVDATREGARLAGLSESTVEAVLSLQSSSTPPATDAARLFPEYLAAVERLAQFVDSWRG